MELLRAKPNRHLLSGPVSSRLPMPPRPFHRWKSFWFGILILAFLGWGWVTSMGKGNYVAIQGKLEEVGRLDQSGGYISVVWEGDTPIFSLHPEPIAWMFGREHATWFPKAFKYDSPVDGWRSAAIAHWCLILIFLLVWGSSLAWRWRRMRRLRTSVDDLPP